MKRLLPLVLLVNVALVANLAVIGGPIEAATKRWRPPAPPDLGRAAGSLRGGASRSTAAKLCPEASIKSAAIAPRFWAIPGRKAGESWQLVDPLSSNDATNPANGIPPREIVFGQTLSDRPTFWFYSPYKLDQSRSAQFRLSRINSGSNKPDPLISNPTPIMTQKPGLFAVTLPAGLSLQVGQSYRWSLTIRCGSEPSVLMSGMIQRVSLPTVAAKGSRDELLFYIDNNLWYDALNLAATDRRHWKSLLEMVDLLDVADPRLFPN